MLNIGFMNQEVIKESNKKRILSLLLKKRELTKQELSKEIGTSIPTIITNVNELIEEGLVEEAGVADSTGGRKPVIVKFLPDARYSFGVEMTISNVRIIMINLDSEIKFSCSFSISGFRNIDDIIGNIRSIIENVILENGISRDIILGVGFSLPGTVNEESMVLELAPNMSIKNVDFHRFSDLVGFPIYIENEANLAAFSESNLGIAKETKNLVYISVNEGIGTGIVIQGCLYKGKNKRAGEFGHMIISADGKMCNCGRKGCFEQYASTKALLEAYNHNNSEPVFKLEDFFSMVKEDKSRAKSVLQRYMGYLALGIQNIVLILDPDYVVIGGEISDYLDSYLDNLKEKVFIENNFYCKDDLKLLVSRLKENASILGAAILPMQKVFSINERII